MKTNILLVLLATLFCTACNNNPASNSSTNAADTTVVSQKTDVTTIAPKDTAQVMASTMPDSAFLAKAYNIGVFEVKIGKLAEKKSQNPKVKELAAMMIKDHTDFGKDVAAMIQKKHYQTPTELPADLKAAWNDLDKLSGKDFDKKYADINVAGHKDAITMFTEVSNGSKDADVKKLATDALPTLQKHEEHSNMLLTTVSGQ